MLKKFFLSMVKASMVLAFLSGAVLEAAPKYLFPITFTGSAGANGLEDFPVLVKISEAGIAGFSYDDVMPNGEDLSFALEDGTVLDSEIDLWNPAGESLVWVRIPLLTQGMTFYGRYCDKSVTGAPASQSDGSVWKNRYVGVWHMNEESGVVRDATAHGLAATPMGNAAKSIQVTGSPTGFGRQISDDTSKNYLSIPSYDVFGCGGYFTMSGWVKFSAANGYARVFSRKASYAEANGWEIEMYSGSTANFTARGINNNKTVTGAFYPDLLNNWVHIAMVYDGPTLSIYSNGELIKSGPIDAATDNGKPLSLGNNSAGNESNVRGFMDECRLLMSPASAAWVALEYNIVENNSTVLSYGATGRMGGNDILKIEGIPEEIGVPTPSYDAVDGLSVGDTLTLSMANSEVYVDGVRCALIGWELYSIDSDDDTETLLRSSSDEGEALTSCAYVHAGYSVFRWVWRQYKPEALSLAVRNATYNKAEMTLSLGGMGLWTEGGRLFVAYGPDPSLLTMTNDLGSVSILGDYSTVISRLEPGKGYYAQGGFVADGGAVTMTPVMPFVTPVVDDTGWEAGLWQTYFKKGNFNLTLDIDSLPIGEDWQSYEDVNRIRRRELGPIAAYSTKNQQYTSEVWGDKVFWPNIDQGQFAYKGKMYLKKGLSYKFRTKIDDNEYIKITTPDGTKSTEILKDTANGNVIITSGLYEPSVTGWYDIEIRFGDGSGGAGGYDASSMYVNDTNAGYSKDYGSTWNLLLDPGDGSLFRVEGECKFDLAEVVSGGVRGFKMTFDSPLNANRTIYLATGEERGDDTTASWDSCVSVGTVQAGMEDFFIPLPENWGTDEALVARCYYIDAASAKPVWSRTVFWKDNSLPSVRITSLDASGGDTLVIHGVVDSFTGNECALSVYVGESASELGNVWTGLEGGTITEAGEFTLTLFEGNKESAKYLAPGNEYFIAVGALANGKFGKSEVNSAIMKSVGSFFNVTSSVSRRTLTVNATMEDAGAAPTAKVGLYVGASNDPNALTLSGDFVDMASTEVHTFTHTFPNFETTYYWQLRAENGTAGGTEVFAFETAIASAKTVDNATYTWKANVSEGNWSDPNNWTDNQNGDSLGYPQSTSCGIAFPNSGKIKIYLTESLSVGSMWFNKKGNDVTIANGGDSLEATKLTAGMNQNVAGVRVTFDGVWISGTSNVELETNVVWKLTNGAKVMTSNFYNRKGGDIVIEEGSTLDVNHYYFGLGNTIIDNATLNVRDHPLFGSGKVGGNVYFKGASPKIVCNSGNGFYSELANSNVQLNFVVPVGGYEEAPIKNVLTTGSYFGMRNSNNTTPLAPQTINVLDESPANFAGETITTPLISWAKGINKTYTVLGHLPSFYGAATDDSFVWSEEEYPTTLSVEIVSDVDQNGIGVASYPEAVPGISPTGFVSIPAGSGMTFTAPNEPVSLGVGKRAIAKGYKVYAIDLETLERTLLSESSDLSCTLEAAEGMRELEWQWEIQYQVTVNPSAGGTIAVEKEWVADGTAVKITATPDEGYGLVRIDGGLRPEWSRAKKTVLKVEGKPYTLQGVFAAAKYVATTGSDSNGGTSWEDAYATVAKAVAANPNSFIYVADGEYIHDAQVTLTGSTIISGTSDECNARFVCTQTIAGDSGTIAMFRLDGVDTRLENITLTTTYTTGSEGTNDRARGVFLNGMGTVESCVITNCRTKYTSFQGGGGVCLKNGGVVRNSTIINCSTFASGGYNACGGNVFMEGEQSIVENCLILGGNSSTTYIASSGGGNVCINGNSTLRNCLVAGGTSGHTDTASGIRAQGGTIENCTIVGNYKYNGVGSYGLYVVGGNLFTIRNSVIYDNYDQVGLANWKINTNANANNVYENNCSSPALPGSGNVDCDPSFKAAEQGDYRLNPSAITDKGVVLDWMEGACDAGGTLARILGAGPDLGCFELSDTEIAVGFEANAAGMLDEDDITVRAILSGVGDRTVIYTWTFTDNDGNVVTRSGTDLGEVTITLPIGVYDISLSIDAGDGMTASVTRPSIAQVYTSVAYVNLDGGHIFPFNTEANAATNIIDAINAVGDGSVIHLGEGWHNVAEQISVTKAIKIIGDNGPEKTFIHGTPVFGSQSILFVNNPSATISGVYINGLNSKGKRPSQWGGLELGAFGGTVTNSIIANHQTVNNTVSGAGLRMANGTVVDCVFSNNHTQCSGGAGFRGALFVNGVNAIVDRCLVVSNRVTEGGISYGGGFDVKSGLVRNCLVGWNISQNYGGGLNVDVNGIVRNCTIVHNMAYQGNGGAYVWGAGRVEDCLFYKNMVNNTYEDIEDPGFVDAENGDFHLSAASSAVDAGGTVGVGERDLDGKARISGSASDKGCYEFDQSQFTIGIAFDRENIFSREITLKAVIMPSSIVLDPEKTFWTVDGTEPSSENYALKGAEGSLEFEPGIYTVRFVTEHAGERYEFTKDEWFTVYSETIYLATESENPTPPYATWETAATDFHKVVKYLTDGVTLMIGEGNFVSTNSYALVTKSTITSVSGPEKTTIDANGKKFMSLGNEDAVVEKLRVINANVNYNGSAFEIMLGTVRNCVIEDCIVASGGVVNLTGGTITDSVIRRAMIRGSNNGAAIYMNNVNAVVDRCVIEGSCEQVPTSHKGTAAVYVNQGEIRNSLIVSNRLYNTSALGLYATSKAYNCTIADNVVYGDGAMAAVHLNNGNALLRNCVVYGNRNEAADKEINVLLSNGKVENCATIEGIGSTPVILTRDPFVRMGEKRWMPKAKSQLRDSGMNESWMFGAFDLFGRPRIQGRTGVVDIGAIECDKKLPALYILR